jgi:hypothetical protein
MTLQEFFFRKALAEVGITDGVVEVDHFNGLNFHKRIGTVPIVFPMSIVNRVRAIPKLKKEGYAFSGVINPGREWILKYPNVQSSTYGRNPETKYTFHEEYYAKLCDARFGIAPTGDCPWSYRFFESIMCWAIPVLSDDEKDIFSEPFFFYRDFETKVYQIEKCQQNYEIVLSTHTLCKRSKAL